KIAALLFIPIIENCFKYGINQTESVVIKIHITVSGNEILLETYNKKSAKNITELEKTETGIINTQKRLDIRSEEHTSELQSREKLVCRLLLEKKNLL